MRIIITLVIYTLSSMVFAKDKMQALGYLYLDGVPQSIQYQSMHFVPIYNDVNHSAQIGRLVIGQDYLYCISPKLPQEGYITMKKGDAHSMVKCSVVNYFEIKNGHAKILHHTLATDAWVQLESDVLKNEFMDEIIQDQNTKIKFTLNQPPKWEEEIKDYARWSVFGFHGYRLRSEPDSSGEILVKLNKAKHVIKAFTGKIKNDWAETIIVEVNEVPSGCYSENDLSKVTTGKEWKGWLYTSSKDFHFIKIC